MVSRCMAGMAVPITANCGGNSSLEDYHSRHAMLSRWLVGPGKVWLRTSCGCHCTGTDGNADAGQRSTFRKRQGERLGANQEREQRRSQASGPIWVSRGRAAHRQGALGRAGKWGGVGTLGEQGVQVALRFSVRRSFTSHSFVHSFTHSYVYLLTH